MDIQKTALESQRRDLEILENRVDAEKNKPLNQRSTASELLGNLKPAVELAETGAEGHRGKDRSGRRPVDAPRPLPLLSGPL